MSRLVIVVLAAVLAGAPDASASSSAQHAAAVDQAAREAGLSRLAEPLALAALGGVQLRRVLVGVAPVALGTTRLGGSPDLPLDTRWPRCGGRPMAFVGQVRADELPPAPGLPATGLLAFFTQIAPDPAARRRVLWAGDCSAVVSTPPERMLRRRRAPRQRPRVVLRDAVVDLRPEAVVPGIDAGNALGAPLEAVRLGPRDTARFEVLRARLAGPGYRRHRLLGYPDSASEDPRAQCAAGDVGGAPGAWRLLLQLDADPELGFAVVGGAGRLSVLVQEGPGLAGRVCSVFDARVTRRRSS